MVLVLVGGWDGISLGRWVSRIGGGVGMGRLNASTQMIVPLGLASAHQKKYCIQGFQAQSCYVRACTHYTEASHRLCAALIMFR